MAVKKLNHLINTSTLFWANSIHVHFRNPYSESIKEMLTTFGTATYKVGLKVHPNEEDPRVPIMCWGSCAYTIQSIGKRFTIVSTLSHKHVLTWVMCRSLYLNELFKVAIVWGYKDFEAGSIYGQNIRLTACKLSTETTYSCWLRGCIFSFTFNSELILVKLKDFKM